MKLQWSIQSSHTQLVLSQVVYLNYRNEHIWPPTRKWLHIFEAFHSASLQFIAFDHFWTIHLILKSVLEIFIFQYWEWAFDFLSIIYFNLKCRFLFFLVKYQYMRQVFAAQDLFFTLRSTFGELFCKNIKIKWEDI